MTDNRFRTTCGRCGTTVRHAYGVAPRYCRDCQTTLERRRARR